PYWEPNGLANFRSCMTGTTCAHPNDLNAQVFARLTDKTLDFEKYTDYTVSADVTLGVSDTTHSTLATLGISTRSTTTSNGYEFQLYVPENQTAGYVRLFDRSAGSAFATNTDVTYTMGTTVNMKIDVNGNLVKCYLDDVLVITYADENNTFTTGSCGIRFPTKNLLAVVDNFKVVGKKILPNKFYDDFSSYTQQTPASKASAFKKAGWWLNNYTASGVINDGKITIPSDYGDNTHVTFLTSGAKGALAWNHYSVEADVSTGSGTLNTDVYAGVSGRHNGTTGITPYGYEISIYEKTAGKTGVRILKRGTSNETLADVAYTIKRDTVYNLKAVFQGNTISVYVNDTFVTSATDDTYKIGYAGIRYIGKNAGVVTTVDNFVVYDLEVASLLPNFEENFDAHAAYATDHAASKDLLISDGWASDVSLNNTFAGHSDTGAWVVPAADANIAKHCLRNTKASYKNHKIECDVIFDVTADKAQDNVVAILGGTTDNSGNGGYGIKFFITAANEIRQIEIRNKSSNKLNPVVAGEGDVTIFQPTSSARPSVTGVVVHITLEFKDTLLTATIDYGTATEVLNYTMPAPVNGCPALCTNVTDLTAGGVTYDNIKVYDTDNPNVPKVEVVGDANGDGTLDEADLTALRAYILGANGAAEITCDANYDGETSTLTDLIRIERLLASL
ncbi:MAG: dockerin type I repeat-containing protein, partial [Clostridia bacterium]|nr:dockerin type I repeat-containing protein [Clostridia bacterium]